jgi:hypothetical protein
MGYFHIHWQRSKKDYETFSGHASKNIIPYTERAQSDKYSRSSIYQMKFLDCPLKYIGQRGEHLTSDIKDTYMIFEATVTLDIKTIYRTRVIRMEPYVILWVS